MVILPTVHSMAGENRVMQGFERIDGNSDACCSGSRRKVTVCTSLLRAHMQAARYDTGRPQGAEGPD